MLQEIWRITWRQNLHPVPWSLTKYMSPSVGTISALLGLLFGCCMLATGIASSSYRRGANGLPMNKVSTAMAYFALVSAVAIFSAGFARADTIRPTPYGIGAPPNDNITTVVERWESVKERGSTDVASYAEHALLDKRFPYQGLFTAAKNNKEIVMGYGFAIVTGIFACGSIPGGYCGGGFAAIAVTAAFQAIAHALGRRDLADYAVVEDEELLDILMATLPGSNTKRDQTPWFYKATDEGYISAFNYDGNRGASVVLTRSLKRNSGVQYSSDVVYFWGDANSVRGQYADKNSDDWRPVMENANQIGSKDQFDAYCLAPLDSDGQPIMSGFISIRPHTYQPGESDVYLARCESYFRNGEWETEPNY